MPWCEECSRYLTPTSTGPAGECPRCGAPVAAPETADEPHAPWHFKLLVVATVVYLAWRLWQGVAWLVGRL